MTDLEALYQRLQDHCQDLSSGGQRAIADLLFLRGQMFELQQILQLIRPVLGNGSDPLAGSTSVENAAGVPKDT